MDHAQLPSESVAQCATSMSSRHKSIATIYLCLDGLFVISAIAMLADHKRPDASTLAAGMAFWVGLLTILSVWQLSKARKRTRFAKLAASEPTMRWFLNGKMIVAASETGAPLPDKSFKITSGLLTVLTAVPRAHVVAS